MRKVEIRHGIAAHTRALGAMVSGLHIEDQPILNALAVRLLVIDICDRVIVAMLQDVAAVDRPPLERLETMKPDGHAEIDRNLDPYPLRPGDTVLLASDGMFKTLTPDEIRSCLEGPGTSWPEILVQRTLGKQREYQDNVTVLSVTVDGVPQGAITTYNFTNVSATHTIAATFAANGPYTDRKSVV